jgi:hypothetical protein
MIANSVVASRMVGTSASSDQSFKLLGTPQ